MIQGGSAGGAKVVPDHHRHGTPAGIASQFVSEVSEILNDDVSLREQERPELTVGGCGEAVSMADDEASTVRVALVAAAGRSIRLRRL